MPERLGHEPWRRVDPAMRARQFAPFAALRGYYDLVRERERVVEPRREMSEESAEYSPLTDDMKAEKRASSSLVKCPCATGNAKMPR